MCFPPFNLNNCWMLKTELLPISFGSFSSEDFMGTHTHTWQTITAGKKQKSPFLPKYQRRGISWSSLLKPREEVRKEKNCVLKQGLSPLRSVMANKIQKKKPQEMLLILPTINQSKWTWPHPQPSSYRHTLITLTIPESSIPKTSNCIFPHFAMQGKDTDLPRAGEEPCSWSAWSTDQLLPSQRSVPSPRQLAVTTGLPSDPG